MSGAIPRLCEHDRPRLGCQLCNPTRSGSAAEALGRVLVRLMDRDTPDRRAMRDLARRRRAELRVAPQPGRPTPPMDLVTEVRGATAALRDASLALGEYRRFLAERGLSEEFRAWRQRRAAR